MANHPQAYVCLDDRTASLGATEDAIDIQVRGGLGACASRRVHYRPPRPKGGFAEDEVRLAREAGCVPISLGPRILRSETAGIVAAALVMHELGEMGGYGSSGASVSSSGSTLTPWMRTSQCRWSPLTNPVAPT